MPHHTLARNRPLCCTCHRPMHRHGDRRYKCPSCRRTLRFEHRPLGRPPETTTLLAAFRFLHGQCSIRDLRHRYHRSLGATHARLQCGLHGLRLKLQRPRIPRKGALIAIVDALWLWVKGERVTVYVILLKRVYRGNAITAVVYPERGWEGEAGWIAACKQLSPSVRRRIFAATIDEHSGLRSAVSSLFGTPEHPPLIQWCQFHCLAELLRKLGKKRIRHNAFAQMVWENARDLFQCSLGQLCDFCLYILQAVPRDPRCPAKVKVAAAWFVSRLPQTCVAHIYESLGIPGTTGSAEATCKRLRKLLTRVRPTSFERVQLLLASTPNLTHIAGHQELCRGTS